MNARSLLYVICAMALCGCTHSLVYDKNRDKQGQEAVKAATEAHLADTVDSLHKVFADMAQREETAARDRQAQLFEWEVMRVSKAPSLVSTFEEGSIDGLIPTVRARLGALGVE